jgi:hypothetical protein
MPSGSNKGLIIAGAALVVLGILFIMIRNYWISMAGFILGIVGILVIVAAMPKAGKSGQGQA